MNQKIFYLLLLMIVSMESQAEIKSTPFDKNSFNKIACSPAVDKSIKEGVFFNMPKTVLWGQAIPICGYLKGDKVITDAHKMISFQVHIRRLGDEDLHNDYLNSVLGTPPIRAMHMAVENDETFFNGNIQNSYTTLEPGQYTISIRYLKFESERKKIEVISSGWRKELAHFLSQETCEDNMVKSLSHYLQLEYMLTVIDLTPRGLEEALISSEKAWHKGFKQYKPLIKNEWRKGLKESQQLDRTVPLQATKLLKENCNKKELNDSNMYVIYGGLREFESEQLPKD